MKKTLSKAKKSGAKKALLKAQDGKVVRTKDENVSATAYPTINPASNAQRKSNVNREFDYPGEYTERYSSGPTTTKKGPFGRTVQKTTSTDTTVPSSGKAYGTKTTEKDVFNKKGQLIKSVSKERDINTGKLEKVNRANYKTWTGKKGGVKMKTGGPKTNTVGTTNPMTTIKKSDYPSSDAYLKAMDDARKQGKTVYSPKEASPATWKKMKTGGMVNPNSKLKALAKAGSKGVKSNVNPKASASKKAKGRPGKSTAPKGAVPKAKYGMVMRRK